MLWCNNPDFLKISEEKIKVKSDKEINLTKEYETGGKNSIDKQILSFTERTYKLHAYVFYKV